MGRKRNLDIRMSVMRKLDDEEHNHGLVKNGEVEKNIDNKVASFLTAVYDMGVKPAVARYSRIKGELNGKPIMDFIYSVMETQNSQANDLLTHIQNLQDDALRKAQRQIVEIGLAMKCILRTYPEKGSKGKEAHRQ